MQKEKPNTWWEIAKDLFILFINIGFMKFIYYL